VDLSVAAALLIFGALLTVVAALSGVMRGTVRSRSRGRAVSESGGVDASTWSLTCGPAAARDWRFEVKAPTGIEPV
jgi:hypothetical protein